MAGKKTDPLSPRLELLMKLGSIVVHADEALSIAGHAFDIEAMKPLIADSEVQDWMNAMGVYLPLQRAARKKAVKRG